jgi:hypothetical protein
MFRVIAGACCAVATVLLLSSIAWVPAEAVELNDPIGEKTVNKVDHSDNQNAATYPTLRPSPEIDAARRLNRILDSQLVAPLEYVEIPLEEILNVIQDDYNIPIVFDYSALEDLGITAGQEVSINLRNITLRAALELMLKQVPDLTYLPVNQVLLITTIESADQHLEVRVYQIGDLLDSSRLFNGMESEEAYQQLITVITHSVNQDSWKKNRTGEGEIRPLQPGLLVISQTHRVHQLIIRLLADIREAMQHSVLTQNHTTSATQLVTQGIEIEVECGENPMAVYQEIYESIIDSVDWEVADSTLSKQQVWLKILPDRLLVRHLPRVVNQVKRITAEMKLTPHSKITSGG